MLRAARAVLATEGVPRAEVSVALTDDETIRALNRDYRHQDRPTDVLSFSQRDRVPGTPSLPPPSGQAELLGDVVISVETASRQAAERGADPGDELALLVVHGILHLLGYDDETDEGAALMREHEKRALEAAHGA